MFRPLHKFLLALMSIALVLGAAPAMAASPTYDVVLGHPLSSPLTLQFKSDLTAIMKSRLAAAPSARPATICVAAAPTGDPGNDGTIASPWDWDTLKSYVENDISNTTANVRIAFRNGDEFTVDSGILFDGISKITVGNYQDPGQDGTQGLPRIKHFSHAYAAGGWTQAGATNRWTRAETTAIGEVRLRNNNFHPLIKAASTAEVEAIPGSWYWAANVLHVNCSNVNYYTEGVATASLPNDLFLEACPGDGLTCFQFNGGTSRRIENLFIEGFGVTTDVNAQTHSIGTSDTLGWCDIVVENVTVTYGGYHLRKYVGNTIATEVNVTQGWANPNGSGVTLVVAFEGSGNCELLSYGLKTIGVVLPATNDQTCKVGECYYSHATTTSVISTQGLFVIWGHQQYVGDWCTMLSKTDDPLTRRYGKFGGDGASWSNFTPTTLSTCRSFVIEEKIDMGCAPVVPKLATGGTIYINCRWKWTVPPGNVSQRVIDSTSLAGNTTMFVNCIIDFSNAEATWNFDATNGLLNHGAGSVDAFAVFLNSKICVRGGPDCWGKFMLNSGQISAANAHDKTYLLNSIYGTPDKTKMGFGGSDDATLAARFKKNAICGVTNLGSAFAGYTNAVAADVIKVREMPADESLPTDSQLIGAGAPIPAGLLLDYDYLWRKRNVSAPSIGPFESVQHSVPAGPFTPAFPAAFGTGG